MRLIDITKNSSYFTDEIFQSAELLSFSNKAIARINIECNTYFKDIESLEEDYKEIPKSWLFSLLSPYISYGIKMNDTSLTEARMYLEEFYNTLKSFKDNLYNLVKAYENGDTENGVNPDNVNPVGLGGAYPIDNALTITSMWFGDNTFGGNM